MPQYIYRIQPTRLAMLTDSTPEEDRIVSEHFAYLKRLMEEGVLILAGRTLNTDERSFGIAIFNAADEATMQAITEGDPAVRAGVFRAEWFPYRVALIREANAAG